MESAVDNLKSIASQKISANTIRRAQEVLQSFICLKRRFLKFLESVLIMAPQNMADILEKTEVTLKKCFVISNSIEDIALGIVNKTRRRVVYLANCLTLINIILNVIWSVAPLDSPFYCYLPNPYYSFGRLGRFISATHAVGHPLTLLYSVNILMNEARGSLTPLTNLKHLFDKLPNPSQEETKKLTLLLKLLCYLPFTNFLGTIPLFSVVAIGSIVTAYRLNSMTFLLASIPVLVIEAVSAILASHGFVTATVLIIQSSRYFLIRLERANSLLSHALFMPLNRELHKTHVALLDLDHILDEVKDHNRCIKYWLSGSLMSTGGVITLLLVFAIESRVWYEKAFIFIVGFFIQAFLSVSFSYAAYLFVKIRSTANTLHSLQTRLQIYQQTSRSENASVLIRGKGYPRPADVIKLKYQTLRLIHRMTSPFLRIGFTEGDGESFSPESVGSMFSTVVLGSLMFLNTKYSSLKYLLNK